MDLASKNNQVVIGKRQKGFNSAPELTNNHNNSSSRHYA